MTRTSRTSLRSNIAFVADYDRFRERAYFGLNDYDGTDNMVSLNMMYNHYFSFRHSLIVGVQSHLQFLDESLLNPTPWLDAAGAWNLDRQENEVGAYAEYTYTIKDKLSVVAGIRGDYNGYYDKFYVTPRGHIKWNITPTTILRGSAGLGYRSTNVITDNIGVLATGRHITFERPTALSAGATAVRGPLNPGSAYGDIRPGWSQTAVRAISKRSTGWRKPSPQAVA